jgi:hypothetical protein
MAITKTQAPYEFLARWKGGVLVGAHIKMLTTIADGDTVLSVQEGDAMPVSLAGEAGFPLADALAALNTAALADGDAKAAQIATLTGQCTQFAADRDAAIADKQALAAQLNALQPAAINGVPQTMHKWQALIGLRRDGLHDGVVAFLATLSPEAQDLWNESTMVERGSPLFVIAKTRLGWTDAQIDDMYVRYSKITLADVTG